MTLIKREPAAQDSRRRASAAIANHTAALYTRYVLHIRGGRPRMISESVLAGLREQAEAVATCQSDRLCLPFDREPGVAARYRAETRVLAFVEPKPPRCSQVDSPVDNALDSHGGENVSNRVHINPDNWTNKQQIWTIVGRLVYA